MILKLDDVNSAYDVAYTLEELNNYLKEYKKEYKHESNSTENYTLINTVQQLLVLSCKLMYQVYDNDENNDTVEKTTNRVYI